MDTEGVVPPGGGQALEPALLELAARALGVEEEKLRSAVEPRDRSRGSSPARWQDDVIEAEIPEGASVLDLGCGSGELLARLIGRKGVSGQGVELDPEAVFGCVARGVPIFQADLDEGLRGFAPASFDYVVLEETLQTLHRPLEVLRDMLRVGRRGVVSFPNFAHWAVRLQLLSRGTMPVTERLPHAWYDSPNIHLFTLRDFLGWVEGSGVRVSRGWALDEGGVRPLAEGDHLRAEEVLVILEVAARGGTAPPSGTDVREAAE